MSGPTRAAELWLIAGQDLLRKGGIRNVKLCRLTKRLGLTTGSFYHHFRGMDAYLDELAHYYGGEQVREAVAELSALDPHERLRGLAAKAAERNMLRLDAAMREWALSSKAAAAAVRSADDIILRFIAAAFTDLGYGRREARVRAMLVLAAGVARITPPWPTDRRDSDLAMRVLAP